MELVVGNISLNMITLIIIFLITIILFFYSKYKTKNLPPGPIGLPIVGYLPWIYNKPLDATVSKLHEKFGSIFSLYVGSKLVVFLGTYRLMYEAYVTQGDKFSGKPRHSPMEMEGNEQGISLSNGLLWKEQRNFVIKLLNDLGVGKQIFEPEIIEEIQQFMRELRIYEDKPIYLHDMLGTSIANNICMLVFGKRFEYNDKRFIQLKHDLDELTCSLRVFHFPMHFPWMAHLPFTKKFGNQKYSLNLRRNLYDFAAEFIKEHERNFNSEEHRDLIYAWLDERANRTERQKSNEHFTIDSLQFNLVSLFLAATETTNSTLLTALGYMIKYPSIQEKCRKEIYDVIGRNDLPTISHKYLLPYTDAILLEAQRLAGVNPYNLVHSTTEDTTLAGYDIPKDAIIYGNILRTHRNPEDWPEPEKFLPERFLDADNHVINQNKIMPFSIGKRICLGATMAKMEMFLYFTILIQNFTFTAPEDSNFVLEYYGNLVRVPKAFKLCVRTN